MCAGLAAFVIAIRNISRRPDRIPKPLPVVNFRQNRVRNKQMQRKKASYFPQALLNLFDQYVHGAISRRAFLDGAQNFAVGGGNGIRTV